MIDISLDLTTLANGYDGGALRVTTVMETVLARIEAAGDDHVWISRCCAEEVMGRAARLDAMTREQAASLPLFGIPFAVKDNIDVAGIPTTAACPDFAYMPERTSPVVQSLQDAGAILIGKTNLDQFATGLVGVRSPYGVPRNPFDARYVPGGSSSGSAVAVSSGLVSFSLGTDTAGSGRVPAAFNNIVGLKPTSGLVSARGVVPACRSLDCVSVFALTVPDAALVLDTMRGPDPEDGFSREAPAGFSGFGTVPARFAFGVPRPEQREFFGDSDAAGLFEAAIVRLQVLGGETIVVDIAPFLEAATLLYRGAWLAERSESIDTATGGQRDILHDVTRRVIAGGDTLSGAAAFRDRHRLAELAQRTRPIWRQVDLLLMPTTGTIYRIDEIKAEPVDLNERL